MASDDRPDDRRRFTLRRFFSPDDAGDGADADATAPAEDAVPAEDAAPAEAFGTGDVDDAALDAVVEGAGPSAIVWSADEVPPPVPGTVGSFPTPSADPDASADEAPEAEAPPLAEVESAEVESAETVPQSDELMAEADAAESALEPAEAEAPEPLPADDLTLSFDSAVLYDDDEVDEPSAVSALGASVLGALADAIEPDDLDAPLAGAADRPDPFGLAELSPEDDPAQEASAADAGPDPEGLPLAAEASADPFALPDQTDGPDDDASAGAVEAQESGGEDVSDPFFESPDFAAVDPVADLVAADPAADEPEAADLDGSGPEAAEPVTAEAEIAPGPAALPADPDDLDGDDTPDALAPPAATPPASDPSADAESPAPLAADAAGPEPDDDSDAAPEAAQPEAVEPVLVPAEASGPEAAEPEAAESEAHSTEAVAPEAVGDAPDDEASDAETVASAPAAEAPDDAIDASSDADADADADGSEAAAPVALVSDPDGEEASEPSAPAPEASATEPDREEATAASVPEPVVSASDPGAEEASDAEPPSFGDAPAILPAGGLETDAAPPLPDAEAGDGSPFPAPPTAPALVPAALAPTDPPPDPEPPSMQTAEIDAETPTTETTAAVDEAFEAQTDPDKAVGADGVEGDLDVTPLGPDDFAPGALRGALRTMMLSRKLDEKMLTLLKQGKGFFHIGSAGHEASQIAVAQQFEGGSDWFCFYYRDLATALTVGLSPADVFRAHYGKADDPFGGGRQMPEHFGHRGLNILSTSSSVGAQYVPAVGFALACQREDGDGPRRAVYASGGEGSTSQGAFHEALNWAAKEALPVLFHVQDNKFAISVPVEEQTAGGSIWHLLGGYAGLKRLRYDGTDFFESVAAARAAMAHIRAGHGPVALHADLVRLLPHSSSDDHKKYREAASLEADAARDPIPRLAGRLVEAGVMTEAEVEALRAEVAAEIDRLAKEIEKEADPDPATATAHVYYEGEDTRAYEAEGEAGDLVVMVDAINHALDEEMTRDPKVLVYGEDVGGGKGGVFTATRGLTAKHGRDRCFNSPLAEHSILGSAVGLAAAGYKPVVEIQFADYIWPGMQQLRNQIASMRYRSNGAWACPMVIRVPAGGYIHGGLCHSQNVEAIFGHFPGLHVVMPSNAADAKGLLKTAIRGEDPVLFLEHKALYRQGPARRPEPHDEYLVPLGKAAVAREGSDLTIVTWGAIVYKALAAAKALEKEGVSVEVIDVRSFLPFDAETVLASVKKTGRVLIAYEDHEFMGFGAEIAAQVADGAFGALDAPVKRVAGAFSSIPYADPLEKAVLPQDADVLTAAREVLAY